VPPENPAQEPNPPSLYASTPVASEVLERLAQGMGVRKPLLLLTGESGMGKTPLARAALERFGERATIAWMLEPHLDAKELMPKLVELFGGTTRPGTSPLAHAERLLMTLANATAGGRVAVLVVDDAHTLPDDVLLELQRVADRAAQRQCPFEILLVGQPSLAARLAQPALAAVSNQISLQFELSPLNAHHTRRYLLLLPAPPDAAHPTQFSRKACRDIHNASRGVSRDIEALAAESARLAGRANAPIVSPEHVRAAAQALAARPKPKPAAIAVPKPAVVTPKPVATPNPPAAEAKPVPLPKHVTPTPRPKSEAKKSEPTAEPAKSEPAKADASNAISKAKAAKPEAKKAPEESSGGEFVPSDDPRVQSWVARFGGSGVRLGGVYTGALPDEPVERAASASFGATRSFVNDMNDTPPTASAGGSLDVRGEVTWPPPAASASRSRSRKGPVLGKRSGSNLVWPAVALALAVALGAVMFAQRRSVLGGTSDATKSKQVATNDREKEPAKSVKTPSPATSAIAKPKREERKPIAAVPERAARTSPTTRTTRKPEPTALTALERTGPSVPVPRSKKAKPEVTGRAYTILVGSFLKSDMAFAEREHLSRLTNHPVWVSRRSINGVRTYRIILGAFESTEMAEGAAQSLLQRGLIRDANVLALPLDP
jgi:type II secretory pathway predicted ATPase ExeA